jgi:heptosyltransferase III
MLVIRGGAIGDFILTIPAIAALRERFPETRLEVLGYPHIARVAMAADLVDEVQSIEARSLAGFFARNGELDEKLAAYFRSFNVIVSYLYDPDEIFKTNVRRCSNAQYISGPYRPDESGEKHASDVFLSPLQRLAIFDADPVPRIVVASQPPIVTTLLRSPRPCIALHPGSGSEQKNWPEAQWRELLQQLLDRTQFDFLLVAGEAEGDRIDRLSRSVGSDRVQLALSLPLVDLAALLQQCAVFIGHDSGISHLAAAVGLKGLVLWAHTNEQVWRPRSDRFVLLRASTGMAKLPVNEVFAAVLRQFGL